ncbi:hypothetical protein FACS1894191_3140 [Clostridia bacterium]|nr:hypothetical protein FACS1894191_3140 [Clostridia bacterium]
MTNTADGRLEMIGSSILTQAEHESRELIDKANHEREHELALFEEQIIQDMFGKVQKQAANIRLGTVKAVSAAQTEARHAVLKRREELAATVFTSVRARLADYVKTAAYTQSLKDELLSIAGAYDHSASTVYLREADMALAGEIKAILEGCAVTADAAIKNGGWKLHNTAAGILIDETLDTSLNEQKPWFLLNSGLSL